MFLSHFSLFMVVSGLSVLFNIHDILYFVCNRVNHCALLRVVNLLSYVCRQVASVYLRNPSIEILLADVMDHYFGGGGGGRLKLTVYFLSL